jgi:hypothetical protein
MSAAMESGDVTFVRSVALKPSPPSLDYWCGKCGKRITDWSQSYINEETKLVLVGRCHGLEARIHTYLGLGGTLF